jgi:hypothetical protein
MNYAIEVGSGAMIYIQTQRKEGDLISLLSFIKNKESNLKTEEKVQNSPKGHNILELHTELQHYNYHIRSTCSLTHCLKWNRMWTLSLFLWEQYTIPIFVCDRCSINGT